MKRVLLLLSLGILFVSNAQAQSFILDENDAAIPSGWLNGSSQTSVAFGGDYKHDNLTHDGSFVEWDLTGQVDSSKCYEISAIWNANGSGTRATNVKYEIDHDGGTAQSFQNQNLNTNAFNVLSTSGGMSVFQNPTAVRVFTGDSSSSEPYIIADAIQVSEEACTSGSGAPVQPGFLHRKAHFNSMRTMNAGNEDCIAYLHISNITDDPIDISVSMYRSSGAQVLDGDNNTSTGNFRVYYATPLSYTDAGPVNMQLAAKQTVLFTRWYEASGQSTFEQGEISWAPVGSNDPEYGLLVNGEVICSENTNHYEHTSHTIVINSGLPF